ncbi:hypothetical protein KR009_007862 [Drosophila setifemur]|nr:hypothetical protein KR009_007862 [Drosophila setifemur]
MYLGSARSQLSGQSPDPVSTANTLGHGQHLPSGPCASGGSGTGRDDPVHSQHLQPGPALHLHNRIPVGSPHDPQHSPGCAAAFSHLLCGDRDLPGDGGAALHPPDGHQLALQVDHDQPGGALHHRRWQLHCREDARTNHDRGGLGRHPGHCCAQLLGGQVPAGLSARWRLLYPTDDPAAGRHGRCGHRPTLHRQPDAPQRLRQHLVHNGSHRDSHPGAVQPWTIGCRGSGPKAASFCVHPDLVPALRHVLLLCLLLHPGGGGEGEPRTHYSGRGRVGRGDSKRVLIRRIQRGHRSFFIPRPTRLCELVSGVSFCVHGINVGRVVSFFGEAIK